MLGLLVTVLLFVPGGTPLLVSAGLQPPRVDLLHRVEMDQRGSYILLWTPRKEDIVFEVQVRTKGYVGLGFSPSGAMNGADIVLGWIDEKGVAHFSDRYAEGQRTPVEDHSQDYHLLAGYSNDSHTVLRFSRPWITCDDAQDFQLTGDTIRVIWAYDSARPDPSRSTLNMHDHRGTKSIYLKEGRMRTPSLGTAQKHWDIRAPSVELPNDFDTLYWCKLYKIPDLGTKHHAIGYVPLIDERSLPHVHHMLLYECTMFNSEYHLEKWVREKGAQCYSKNMPVSWTACGTAIVAWAIGSQGEMLPDHVGFPIGEKHGGSTYYLLEIHYDNPTLRKGVVDRSGLRMILTDRPRRYDAGVLTLGHKVEPSMIIPPGMDWATTAHCTSDCTRKTFPSRGIRVFSGIMHAHLLGRSIAIQHIRNGKELEPLMSDHNYDFNYQQARFISPERSVRPGDHLITTCRYNATHRTKPTFGGFGTKDEMCLVFLAYYPRLNISECFSRPDLALLFHIFGIEDLYDNDKIMKTFSEVNFNKHSVIWSALLILPKDIELIAIKVKEFWMIHSFIMFSEFAINEKQEIEDIKKMSSIARPGLESVRFKLVDFFRSIIISAPQDLKDNSFYDILTSDSTWRNKTLIKRLEEAVTKQQYEPSCLNSGRIAVTGLPKKGRIRHFIPYSTPPEPCLSSSNWTKAPLSAILTRPPSRRESKYAHQAPAASDPSILTKNELSQTSSSKRPRSTGAKISSRVVHFLPFYVSILYRWW